MNKIYNRQSELMQVYNQFFPENTNHQRESFSISNSAPGPSSGGYGGVDSLPISSAKKETIKCGVAVGQRSEEMMGVLNALVYANLTDEQIVTVFEQYPIGDKYREKGGTKLRWLQKQINKARSMITDKASYPTLQEKPAAIKPKVRGLSYKSLLELYSAKVEWIWRNHLARNEPQMFNGREGTGKTTVCLQMALEMLNKYPDHKVVWLATEGAVKNTLVKMREIGLTSDRFVVAQKSNGDFMFNFQRSEDLRALDDFLKCLESPVICVFIDSLRGATSLDDNDSKIGKIMHQINQVVCDRRKASLVYIHHFSKSQKTSLLDRSTGTTAATAAVRHILSILPVSKLKRIIKVSKSNIDDMLPDLEVVKLQDKIVIFEPDEMSADTSVDQAEEFLTELFSQQSEIPAVEIYEQGKQKGFSDSVLKKAKIKLGIDSKRVENRWFWCWLSIPRDSWVPCIPYQDNHSELKEKQEFQSRVPQYFQSKGSKSSKSSKGDKGYSKKEGFPCSNTNNSKENSQKGSLPLVDEIVDVRL